MEFLIGSLLPSIVNKEEGFFPFPGNIVYSLQSVVPHIFARTALGNQLPFVRKLDRIASCVIFVDIGVVGIWN